MTACVFKRATNASCVPFSALWIEFGYGATGKFPAVVIGATTGDCVQPVISAPAAESTVMAVPASLLLPPRYEKYPRETLVGVPVVFVGLLTRATNASVGAGSVCVVHVTVPVVVTGRLLRHFWYDAKVASVVEATKSCEFVVPTT